MIDDYFKNNQFVFLTEKSPRFICNTGLGFIGSSFFSVWFTLAFIYNFYFREWEFLGLIAFFTIVAVLCGDQFFFSIYGKKILIINEDGLIIKEKGRWFKRSLFIPYSELDGGIQADNSHKMLSKFWHGHEMGRLKVGYLGTNYFLTDNKPLYEIELLAFEINKIIKHFVSE